MAGRISSAALVLVVLTAAVALLDSTAATTHVVGDSLGWNVLPNAAATYANWASQQTFTAGDVLVFNFTTGAHDVARVTKEAFDACNITSPISIQTTGPANENLTTNGEYYFICTIGQHCSLGQKLALNATASAAPASPPTSASPAPAPTPSATTTPTPPPASPSPATPPTSPAPDSSRSPAPSTSTPAPSGSTTSPPPPPSATTAPPPGSSLSPPPSDTTVSPPPPPPPPSSSAPPKAVAAFAAIFMSIAVAVLC